MNIFASKWHFSIPFRESYDLINNRKEAIRWPSIMIHDRRQENDDAVPDALYDDWDGTAIHVPEIKDFCE